MEEKLIAEKSFIMRPFNPTIYTVAVLSMALTKFAMLDVLHTNSLEESRT